MARKVQAAGFLIANKHATLPGFLSARNIPAFYIIGTDRSSRVRSADKGIREKRPGKIIREARGRTGNESAIVTTVLRWLVSLRGRTARFLRFARGKSRRGNGLRRLLTR